MSLKKCYDDEPKKMPISIIQIPERGRVNVNLCHHENAPLQPVSENENFTITH